MSARHEILAPDLGLGETPIVVGSWFVQAGSEVGVGEQLVELLAGDVLVQLSAEFSGVLKEKRVGAERAVRPGEVLGVIEPPDQGDGKHE